MVWDYLFCFGIYLQPSLNCLIAQNITNCCLSMCAFRLKEGAYGICFWLAPQKSPIKEPNRVTLRLAQSMWPFGPRRGCLFHGCRSTALLCCVLFRREESDRATYHRRTLLSRSALKRGTIRTSSCHRYRKSDLAATISHCLSNAPTCRFQSAMEFALAMEISHGVS